METTSAEATPEPQVVFKSGKKRKAYRQRIEEPESATKDNQNATKPAPVIAPAVAGSAAERAADEDDEEKGLSVAEVLRLRNSRKNKFGGVGFRARPGQPSHGDDDGATEEQSLVLHASAEAETEVLGGITQRFAPQTGLAGDLVNKHMEEYVESALARRQRQAAELAAQQEGQDAGASSANATNSDSSNLPFNGPQVDSQRALQGKLMEIDLGDEARARNIEMTERARKRLQGQIDEEDESESRRKTRLGPDGKPWRGRRRRGSEDIKRDQLVEEFLSENKLDIYDVPSAGTPTVGDVGDGDEYAADDRIAEEFRRDFMDAMAQRHRKKRVAQPTTKPGTSRTEEVLKGPKLGGSRNARAAMREILLKEQATKRR
ncbi:hepatocellular carcinoma-associated antigen 59-domain-containing protein [Triangularia verruculosa]|uniref:Hepatocellular carcinoma-associated antigen 59-domain-containing protein n=1 Tax=Triangularia verruculosa TaxID=2587418 RepID=A0AAN6XL68_9PEZI|nr:hepatocellular carcinoma-associated antigen 59-domain-containing protein [Triangularia verruculosa]